MKPLIVLRRFLHQLPKEAKKSIKQDQKSCASGQLQPIASGCLFFYSTRLSLWLWRGSGAQPQGKRLSPRFTCKASEETESLRATTGIVRAAWLACEEGSGDAVGAGAVVRQSLLTCRLGLG